jgi:hypothetical protein
MTSDLLPLSGRTPPPTLQEIDALEARYKAFPIEPMKDAMDTLRSAKVLLSSALRDSMSLLLKSKEVKKIDEYLKTYAPPSPEDSKDAGADKGTAPEVTQEGPLIEMYKELETYRKSLLDDMTQRLKDGQNLEDPAEIQKLMTESQDYGEEAAQDSKALEDHMAKLISTANDEMQKLVKSEELETVLAALEKYKGWDSAKEKYDELDQWKGEMLDEAKSKLLALCGSTDPKEIEDQLPLYEAFGAAVDQEIAAVKGRRENLIRSVNAEMQTLAAKPEVSVSEIEAMLEKYKDEEDGKPVGRWKDEEVGSGKQLLTNLMNAKAQAATDALVALAGSTDIPKIDAAIEANLESQLPGVKDAAEELKKHRQKLQDDMITTLKEAMKLEDPVEIIPHVTAGQAFGEGTQSDVKALEDRLSELYKTANDDMKELVIAKPARACTCILEYTCVCRSVCIDV